MTLQKRNNWFKDYQMIPQLGIKGQRKLLDRIKYFDVNDFKDADVIDIGSNVGQMSHQAIEWGAKYVLAVEYDLQAHLKAIEYNKEINANIQFVLDDVDDYFFWTSINKFDVGLFLSVIDTQELVNRFGILSRLSQKIKNVLYFEGHNNIPYSKYIKNIIDYTTFTEIIYKGTIEDKRAFIRCSRNVLNLEECVKKIQESSYNKIAVIGKALAGKTQIKNLLIESGGKSGYEIIDDCFYKGKQLSPSAIKNFEKIVFFDYRAINYCNNFDVVFFVSPEETQISQVREGIGYIRSTCNIPDMTNIKEIYKVLNDN